MQSKITKVRLTDIDLNNNQFRISRNHVSENLLKSIEGNGILEPPIILENGEHYIVISGFNRLKAAEKTGIREIDAIIEEKISEEFFIRQAVLKSYRNEIGPVGKIRFVRIMKEHFLEDEKVIAELCRKGMNIPLEFSRKDETEAFLNLSPVLLDYIDIRDCNFKIIKNMMRLKPLAVNKLTEWVESTWMRLNYFRSIVDYLYDIQKRDQLQTILDIDADDKLDRKINEEAIFDRVYCARFPEYSLMKIKADSLIDYFNTKKIRVELPAFFEGKTVNFSFTVDSGDSLADIHEKLNEVDEAKLSELLQLL